MQPRDYKHESIKHFNRIASRYDLHRYGRLTRSVHRRVAKMIEPLQPTELLDVGCANGGFLALMQSNVKSLAGADISPEMIKCAKQRLGQAADLRVADSERLPWPDEQFECVACNYSFHHYPNPHAVLVEMRRVLAPGGHLVISDPWFPGPLRWVANLAVYLSRLGDVRMYSLDELRTKITAAGMEVIRAEHLGTSSFVLAIK